MGLIYWFYWTDILTTRTMIIEVSVVMGYARNRVNEFVGREPPNFRLPVYGVLFR